jgi:hypothetical protein
MALRRALAVLKIGGLALASAVLLALAVVTMVAPAQAPDGGCLEGAGAFVTPDVVCTPGSLDDLSRAEVCTPKDHPALRAADRRAILDRYGLSSWAGADGELDHRVPVFLGGRTEPANVWPERGAIPNAKDRLEVYVRARVCSDPPTMRVETARRIFLSDWRYADCFYIDPAACATR